VNQEGAMQEQPLFEETAEVATNAQKSNVPKYKAGMEQSFAMEDPDKKPFKMTDNMNSLGQSRQFKIERELEEEFRQQTFDRKDNSKQ
jgi:hypothetical protein